jgi:hypothetical protein
MVKPGVFNNRQLKGPPRKLERACVVHMKREKSIGNLQLTIGKAQF